MDRKYKEYTPEEIERKWIEIGEKEGVYKFEDDDNPRKLYILDMFPYPSGSGLHVGHLKGYLATDILCRYYTMKGYLVFHPIGGDAFGLPAEQHAINTGNSPKEFTKENIDRFRKQLKRLMLTYDFSWEVDTSEPEYYKHTQGIFSEMYERGLAELVDTQVNGCPELNTVLSDEEIVEVDKKLYSERGNHPVVRKVMKQGILKITKYASELLESIPELEWPGNIKKIQEEWIGKSEKYEYPMRLGNSVYPLYMKYASSIRKLKGVGIHSFSKLSKELNLSSMTLGNRELIKGVKITNLVDYQDIDMYYLHNVDFRGDELIPIFDDSEESFYDEKTERFYLKKERVPVKKVIYKLKDGVFSRQRFGGEPIPILFDESGGHMLDKELPVVLPDSVDYESKRDGKSPLANNKDWLRVYRDGKEYTRETNTMPNWAGSSGYFIAYLLKKKDGTYHDLYSPEAKRILNRGLPVDIYVGGQEHASMHLLYARFGHKFLKQIGVLDTPEPFLNLFNQGMVLGSDGTKMSKSKKNYVCIDEIVDKYGADSLRVYEAFSGPTQLSFKWEDEGIRGSHKGLHKVYVFFNNLEDLDFVNDADMEIAEIENRLISNVESAVVNLKINLGVSEMMIFLNEIQKIKRCNFKSLESFVKILSLYAPGLAEELWWEYLDKEDYVYKAMWPIMNATGDSPIKEFKVFFNGKFKFLLAVNVKDMENKEGLREAISSRLEMSNIGFAVVKERGIILVHPETAENTSAESP